MDSLICSFIGQRKSGERSESLIVSWSGVEDGLTWFGAEGSQSKVTLCWYKIISEGAE